MSNLRTTLVAGVIAATAMAGAASAASLSIIGGTAGDIPGGTRVNDGLTPLGFPTPLSGFFGSAIGVSGPGTVTYTLLGWEAGFENGFSAPAGSFSTEGNASYPSDLEFDPTGIDSFSFFEAGSGLLTFSFSANGGAQIVANGDNLDDSAGMASAPNFFASERNGSIYLFLDDNGGENDDNHDDLVVRVDVTPVPLPAGIWLFATALGGLGLLARKRAAA